MRKKKLKQLHHAPLKYDNALQEKCNGKKNQQTYKINIRNIGLNLLKLFVHLFSCGCNVTLKWGIVWLVQQQQAGSQ